MGTEDINISVSGNHMGTEDINWVLCYRER